MLAAEHEQFHSFVSLGQEEGAKRPVRSHSGKMTNTKTPRVSAWALSFEHLLADAAGLATFAEFLKMEFSAENIYFWTSCERYKSTESQAERQLQAKQIFRNYIMNGCSEPVNLDAQSRNVSDEALRNADRDLFVKPQKQIFHLMKFDSYQRFIRSDLYKNCLRAEEKGLPLPYGADNLDVLLKTNFLQNASPKLKKSASNAEDRRRKILLPWHRKTRSKSRDRIDSMGDDLKMQCGEQTSHGSASTLSGNIFLASNASKTSWSGGLTTAKSSDDCFSQSPLRTSLPSSLRSLDTGCSLCRIKFADEATTIVQIKANETVQQLIDRLLEKRGLHYPLYEVVLKSNNRSMDLQMPSQHLAGEEVEIEQRITFKLSLPEPKVISVKSKPKKYLYEVVGTILKKYNYDLHAVDIVRRDGKEKVDMSQPVTAVDGERLHVMPKRAQTILTSGLDGDYQNANISFGLMKSKELANEFNARNAKNIIRNYNSSAGSANNLDELTNNIFHDIIKEKGRPESLTQLNDQFSLKSDEFGSDISVFTDVPSSAKSPTSNALSIFRLRNKSAPSSNLNASEGDLSKPIIAKLKAGVKLQVTEIVAEKQDELVESLKSRLDNAPLTSSLLGVHLKELPDIVKNKENQCETALNLRQARANLSPVCKTNIQIQINVEPPRTLTRQISAKTKAAIDEVDNIITSDETNAADKGPPPLPPKPKVLPTKPSNWGANISD